MPLDLFNTRSMAAALAERREPKSFLLKTFFSKEKIHTTAEVDIDIIRNKRRLAPFVNPLSEGKLVEHTGYTTRSIRPPYIKPKMVTNAADYLRRSMGDNIYTLKSPEQWAAEQLAKDLAELDDMIERREEWMASRALFTGEVTVTGEGLNALIDFGFSASHEVTLAGAALWSAGTSTPLEDIRSWKSLAAKDSGLVPTDLILGSSVVTSFLRHADVRALLNTLNYRALAVEMRTDQLDDGVTYVGQVEGVNVWSYDEWYLDDAGVEQPMVPVDYVALLSRRADFRRHYGAIMDLEANAAIKRFPKSWVTQDPSARWIMVQSAPLVVPHQVDAIVRAKVV